MVRDPPIQVSTVDGRRVRLTGMGDLVVRLLPEFVGLVITPAVIVATFLLLGSTRPYRNVAVFAAAFMAVYVALSAAIVLGGSALSGIDPEVKAWVSIAVGVLFWGIAGLTIAEHPAVPRRDPSWAATLRDPNTRVLLVGAVVLAVINPNIAILLSGLSAVVSSGLALEDQWWGVAILLLACLLDFVVPVAAYAVTGEAGRERLARITRWLIDHNRVLSIWLLVVFGVLFVVRGVLELL